MTRELERSIRMQPDVLRDVLQLDLDWAADRLRPCARIVLVGTGTSHHAARLAALAFAQAGRDARAFTSAELAHLPGQLGPRDGVIVISHTASSAFARAARARALAGGAPVVAITARGAGWAGALEVAPRETAETYSQSYLAALLALLRLAAALGATGLEPLLAAVPDEVEAAISDPQPDAIPAPARLLVLAGAGPAAVTAAEGALKLREGARLVAEGYEAEALLHGAAVPLGPDDGLVLVAPRLDPDGLVPLLGDAARASGVGVHVLDAPAGVEPLVAQLALTVLVQRLALRLARERGQDADTVIEGPWTADALWAAGAPPA